MTIFKKKIIFLFSLFLSIGNQCLSQAIDIPKNEYGLQVINKFSIYQATVMNDKNNELIPLAGYIPHLKTSFVYATSNNFTHSVLYKNPQAYLRKPAAENLKKVAEDLEKIGLGIKIYDSYRPYSVTKKMWKMVPDSRYAANPAEGSGHNRGASIDLTLYSLETGEDLPMPTTFDNFTTKAHHDYMQLDSAIIANRNTLKEVMIKYGFQPLATEWWHYSLPNAAKKFYLLDLDFSQLKKATQKGK
ncbi:MAG: M15 family metallopeptidase [Chitinophagaceae bacterium]|jgi:D-alanyl-D-alanine dipeptidase|nr:M15 family metallopeptidase [Chitinophagaceae bacterium]